MKLLALRFPAEVPDLVNLGPLCFPALSMPVAWPSPALGEGAERSAYTSMT